MATLTPKAAPVDNRATWAAFRDCVTPLDLTCMTNDDRERLLQYIELCRRTYERMRRENSWPWNDDSQDDAPVVESEDNSNDV